MVESGMETPIFNELGVTDEQARQIGLRLQEKRKENPKSSLADFAKLLKLNESYLKIIESGDWNRLPQSATGRGFVRLYAKALGVNVPEFDKFCTVETVLATPSTQTNLDKILEFARKKRFEQRSDYQRYFHHLATALFRLFAFKKNRAEDSTQPSHPKDSIKVGHAKKWFIIGSLSVFTLGAGVVVFLLAESGSSNFEISEQPINDESSPVVTDEKSEPEALNVASPSKLTVLMQKMQIDILLPVAIRIEADGKQVVNGLVQPGVLNFEFEKNATLVLQDSSKVRLSYAGWSHEPLSLGPRKRTIVLNAEKFKNDHQ